MVGPASVLPCLLPWACVIWSSVPSVWLPSLVCVLSLLAPCGVIVQCCRAWRGGSIPGLVLSTHGNPQAFTDQKVAPSFRSSHRQRDLTTRFPCLRLLLCHAYTNTTACTTPPLTLQVYWDNGENENSFMRDMSAMSNTGAVPVMVSPGNGDYGGGSYGRYKRQWSMPGLSRCDCSCSSFPVPYFFLHRISDATNQQEH